MTKAMTQQQFDAYVESNGYGISSENGNVAYVSDKDGNVVAMFWRGVKSYLETLEEPIQEEEKDPLNPMTWDASQWKDAVIGCCLSVFIFAFYYLVVTIFS